MHVQEPPSRSIYLLNPEHGDGVDARGALSLLLPGPTNRAAAEGHICMACLIFGPTAKTLRRTNSWSKSIRRPGPWAVIEDLAACQNLALKEEQPTPAEFINAGHL